jgi:hypothetical protein
MPAIAVSRIGMSADKVLSAQNYLTYQETGIGKYEGMVDLTNTHTRNKMAKYKTEYTEFRKQEHDKPALPQQERKFDHLSYIRKSLH